MSTIDYGTDLAGGLDLDPMMVERAPDDPVIVAEACIGRLDCPRGGLLDDPDYGYDICGELRRPMTAREVQAIPNRIRSELTKDDRIDTIESKVTLTGLEQLDIEIKGTLVDGGEFALTGPVTRDDIRLEVTTS